MFLNTDLTSDSYGMWCCITWYIGMSVSEKTSDSIFRVEVSVLKKVIFNIVPLRAQQVNANYRFVTMVY
jgi:hypothetical protein